MRFSVKVQRVKNSNPPLPHIQLRKKTPQSTTFAANFREFTQLGSLLAIFVAFFFWDFVGLKPSGTLSPCRRESNALAGYTSWSSISDLHVHSLICEMIRYRLVQVRKNLKNGFSGWRPSIAFLYCFLFHSLLRLTSFLSQHKNPKSSLHRQSSVFPEKLLKKALKVWGNAFWFESWGEQTSVNRPAHVSLLSSSCQVLFSFPLSQQQLSSHLPLPFQVPRSIVFKTDHIPARVTGPSITFFRWNSMLTKLLWLPSTDSCMHRWITMSGIPTREAKQRRYEHNLKLLNLDENVIKSKSTVSGQRLDVANFIAVSFLHNEEHKRSFLACLSMLHWLPHILPFLTKEVIE